MRGLLMAKMKTLLKAFASRDPSKRAEAVVELGWAGEAGEPVLPLLERALRDPDPTVRRCALGALRTAGIDTETQLRACRTQLADPAEDYSVRFNASQHLLSLGAVGVPLLIE